MTSVKDKRRIAAWSSYWSEGNVTSLPNLFPGNYGGDVLRFWSEAFSSLREGSGLLDICTGNGAIAILAKDYTNRKNMRCNIHAIDVATIQPHEHQNTTTTMNEVKFHSGVAVEATPFSDKYFDLIVGQFALEYCEVTEGIQELSRIIQDDGAVFLMMHHAESVTAKNTREFISTAEIFLKEPTIFYRLRKFVEQYARQKNMDAPKVAQKRKQLIASFNEANSLLRRYPKSRFLRVTLDNIKDLAERAHIDPFMKLAEIREFEKMVKHHLIRMQDQRDAAIDADEMSEIEALFHCYGFGSVQCEPFYLDEVLFSWTLRAHRGDVDQGASVSQA